MSKRTAVDVPTCVDILGYDMPNVWKTLIVEMVKIRISIVSLLAARALVNHVVVADITLLTKILSMEAC